MVMHVAAKAAWRVKMEHFLQIIAAHLHEDMGVKRVGKVDEAKVLIARPCIAFAESKPITHKTEGNDA